MAEPFRVVVADPPWPSDVVTDKKSMLASVSSHAQYKLMSIEDICNLDTGHDISENSLLFLWRLSSMQEEALQVCKAWGYKPMSEIVWVKANDKSDVLQHNSG